MINEFCLVLDFGTIASLPAPQSQKTRVQPETPNHFKPVWLMTIKCRMLAWTVSRFAWYICCSPTITFLKIVISSSLVNLEIYIPYFFCVILVASNKRHYVVCVLGSGFCFWTRTAANNCFQPSWRVVVPYQSLSGTLISCWRICFS